MLMVGSAIGPVLEGTIVKLAGYPRLGMLTAALAVAGALCFFAISHLAAGASANRQRLTPNSFGEAPLV